MPSPVQSNCDTHDTIANGQYGAVLSMGHTQQVCVRIVLLPLKCLATVFSGDLLSAGVVLLTRPSPCRLLHIPVVLNDIHSRETTLFLRLLRSNFTPNCGDTQAPLLRIVRTKGKDGETISQYYDRPQYLPLVRHSFQTIQSELRLNSGDFVPFERGQIGSGLTHYKGINFQKGYGIGGIFRRLFRAALPF
ncbi:uncharacterized protein F54H12.2 [Trichonephila clavipes]|nr:uncharacterized protein F54H12.2 [Trichonephila clavipes]